MYNIEWLLTRMRQKKVTQYQIAEAADESPSNLHRKLKNGNRNTLNENEILACVHLLDIDVFTCMQVFFPSLVQYYSDKIKEKYPTKGE